MSLLIRPIPGFPNYLADSEGRIWSHNRGRWGSRPPHVLTPHPRGIKRGTRGGYLAVGMMELAERYGVTLTTISAVATGRTWKHLTLVARKAANAS